MATREPAVAPAGLRNPLRRRVATSALLVLRAHFGHPEVLGLLGEAVVHQMMGMVEVGEVVAEAVEAVTLEGAPSPTTPTRSESLLQATRSS